MEGVINQSSSRAFVFGQWVLQSDGLLLHDGNGLHLPPKELHVLRLLLNAAGTLVTKDRLLDCVWPNCDIAQESLTRCIYALRKMLGPQNNYIKTVYGKGYRFVAAVKELKTARPASRVQTLLLLPWLTPQGSCDLDLQSQCARQLVTTFGDALRVMSPAMTVHASSGVERLALIEHMAPDFYLTSRWTMHEQGAGLCVELVRGSDHTLMHSEELRVSHARSEVLLQVAQLVGQRLPGLRHVTPDSHSLGIAFSCSPVVSGIQQFWKDPVLQGRLWSNERLRDPRSSWSAQILCERIRA